MQFKDERTVLSGKVQKVIFMRFTFSQGVSESLEIKIVGSHEAP